MTSSIVIMNALLYRRGFGKPRHF